MFVPCLRESLLKSKRFKGIYGFSVAHINFIDFFRFLKINFKVCTEFLMKYRGLWLFVNHKLITYSLSVTGAPVMVSFPHFYLGDPRLLETVEGLKPDPEKHDLYLDIHEVRCAGLFRSQGRA